MTILEEGGERGVEGGGAVQEQVLNLQILSRPRKSDLPAHLDLPVLSLAT